MRDEEFQLAKGKKKKGEERLGDTGTSRGMQNDEPTRCRRTQISTTTGEKKSEQLAGVVSQERRP
jgi:hypothetical protein